MPSLSLSLSHASKRVPSQAAPAEVKPAPEDDYLKVRARIEAALAEAQEDDEKRKPYFGYLETSEGNL